MASVLRFPEFSLQTNTFSQPPTALTNNVTKHFPFFLKSIYKVEDLKLDFVFVHPHIRFKPEDVTIGRIRLQPRRVVISQWKPSSCTNRMTAKRTRTKWLSSNARQRPRSTSTFGPSVCLRPTLSSIDRARFPLVSLNQLSLIIAR